MNKFRFTEWLAHERARSGLGKSELGRQMARAVERGEAFTPGYVNNLETGERNPTEETIAALAAVFKVDPTWLQAQVDIERLGEDRARAIAAQLGGPASMVVDLKKKLSLSTGATLDEDFMAPWEREAYLRTKPAPKLVKLRFYGKVGAFKKRLPETADEVEVPEKKAKGVDYAVRADGDSMDDLEHPKLPPIPDGALLLVKKNDHPKPGAVVVAALGDGAVVVKQLQRGRDGLYLVSASREQTYPRIPADERVRFLGEVVGVEAPEEET